MSNYRTEKCCLECRHNATELCDADDEPCRYYDGYVKGKADAIKELFNKISTHNNIFRELGWDNDCIDLNTIKILCEQLKEQNNLPMPTK